MNETVLKYVARFGTLPPIYVTMTFESEWYQKKMREAIKSGKPMTDADFDEIKDADIDQAQGKSLPGFGAKR